MWTTGFHHHHDTLAIGVLATGAHVGGARDDRLGPTVMLDLRGSL
jgi:hypothetical protein